MSSEATISQRAMTGARLVTKDFGIATAAERMDVSVRAIHAGRRVLLRGGDELIDSVERGELSVFTAVKKVGPSERSTRTKPPKTKRCTRCRHHRMEIDRLRERLADMTAERDRYYIELETARTTIAQTNPVASAIQTS